MSVQPAFTADKAGLYRIELVIHDGEVNSDAASIAITAQQGNIAPVDHVKLSSAGHANDGGLGAIGVRYS